MSQTTDTSQDLSTPAGYSKFQGSLTQGFLNCIARKNASFKTAVFNFKNKLMPNDRNKAIQAALKACIEYCEDPATKIAVYETGGLNLDIKVDKSANIPTQLQAFAESLVFCFLSVIARKNIIQKTGYTGASNIKAINRYLTDEDQRKTCIINALIEVENKGELGDYVLNAYTDSIGNFFKGRKGGKSRRRKFINVIKSKRTCRR